MAGVSFTQALVLAVSANAVGAWFAAIVAFWKGHYFVPGAAFALGLGIVLLLPLVAIALSRLEEIAAIAFGRPPRRLANAPPLVPEPRAQSVDPCAGLLRAAGHAQGDARCRGAAGLSELRMRGGGQQYAGSGAVAAGRRTLPRARRALQIRPGREPRGLQSRRAAARAHPHRAGCRNHRQHRCRLRRRSGLAQGSGAAIRRSPCRLRAVAAGSSRRRPFADARRHERRICRLLRHRHGAAERVQRHRHARHHVPHSPRRDRQRRRLVDAKPSSRTPTWA